MHPICSQASSRVTAIVFHPKRSLVLYGTEKGTVRLIDFELGSEIIEISFAPDKVRCLTFHRTQPFFAVGTEQSRIHFYDYRTNHLLFTFYDHLQFVTSLDFHVEYPLIISSSSDGTSRVFNWQSRVCVSILDSELYPINCAKFSPNDAYALTGLSTGVCHLYNLTAFFSKSLSINISAGSNLSQIFAEKTPNDVIWDYRCHSDRISDVCWNTLTKNMFATASYDGTAKLWKLDNRNVSNIGTVTSLDNSPFLSCSFHLSNSIPSSSSNFQNFLFTISASGTFYVWNCDSAKLVSQYDMNENRFSSLSVSRLSALAAIGHNSGMIILKLWKERPFYDSIPGVSVWVKASSQQLLVLDTKEQKEQNSITKFALHAHARKVSLNATGASVVVSHAINGRKSGFIEIIDFTNSKKRQRWIANSAIWLSRTTVVALSTSRRSLLVFESNAKSPRKVKLNVDAKDIFSVSPGVIYIATEKEMILFDVTRENVIRSVPMKNVKNVQFDNRNNNRNRNKNIDGNATIVRKMCAFSSTTVYCGNADLTEITSFTDNVKVKSACFFEDIVVYSTRYHLKYFINGIDGIIMSLPKVYYLISGTKNGVWFVGRDGNAFLKKLTLDEMRIVKGIMTTGITNRMEMCAEVVRKRKPAGNFVFDLAKRKKEFEMALEVVVAATKDEKEEKNEQNKRTKFEMAIGALNVDIALNNAQTVEDWGKLAEVAMACGRFEVCEKAYEKSANIDGLFNLYLLSGESEKIKKLLTISKKNNSNNSYNTVFHMVLANDNEGLKNLLPDLFKSSEDSGIPIELNINYGNNVFGDWPMLNTATSISNNNNKSGLVSTKQARNEIVELDDEDIGDGWNIEINENESKNENENENENDLVNEEGWDINIDENMNVNSDFIAPARGESVSEQWKRTSLAGDLAAAGDFSGALLALRDSICVKNVEILKKLFIESYLSSNCVVPLCSALPSSHQPMLSVPLSTSFRLQSVPFSSSVAKADMIRALVHSMLSYFSKGKFNECKTESFRIFESSLILIVETKEEENRVLQLLETARIYSLATALELKRRETQEVGRNAELAIYMTYCGLAPRHELLALKSALKAVLKAKNYKSAEPIASRIIQLTSTNNNNNNNNNNEGNGNSNNSDDDTIAKQAMKVIAIAKKNPVDAVPINFQDRNPFDVCGKTLRPIYRGKKALKCPLCKSLFEPLAKGELCPICNIAEIGAECKGLSILRTKS